MSLRFAVLVSAALAALVSAPAAIASTQPQWTGTLAQEYRDTESANGRVAREFSDTISLDGATNDNGFTRASVHVQTAKFLRYCGPTGEQLSEKIEGTGTLPSWSFRALKGTGDERAPLMAVDSGANQLPMTAYAYDCGTGELTKAEATTYPIEIPITCASLPTANAGAWIRPLEHEPRCDGFGAGHTISQALGYNLHAACPAGMQFEQLGLCDVVQTAAASPAMSTTCGRARIDLFSATAHRPLFVKGGRVCFYALSNQATRQLRALGEASGKGMSDVFAALLRRVVGGNGPSWLDSTATSVAYDFIVRVLVEFGDIRPAISGLPNFAQILLGPIPVIGTALLLQQIQERNACYGFAVGGSKGGKTKLTSQLLFNPKSIRHAADYDLAYVSVAGRHERRFRPDKFTELLTNLHCGPNGTPLPQPVQDIRRILSNPQTSTISALPVAP